MSNNKKNSLSTVNRTLARIAKRLSDFEQAKKDKDRMSDLAGRYTLDVKGDLFRGIIFKLKERK